MSDEKKALIKARLKEIESIAAQLCELLEDDEQQAQADQEGPGNPPPNPPSSGNG